MKSHDELTSGNAALRQSLEAQSPGCTATLKPCGNHATTEQLMGEESDLHAIQSAVAAAKGVQERGAAIVAKHVPTQQAKPTIDPVKARLATVNASTISRLEKQLKSYKAGTTTHSALAAKIARLRGEVPAPVAKSAPVHTQPTGAKPLTTTQKILQAKGLPHDTKVQLHIPTNGGAINEADEISDD
ncbi:MAG: hypothetical protein AAB370_10760 [Verrucomicrobiota bacterium]